jgi:hypothetical protein
VEHELKNQNFKQRESRQNVYHRRVIMTDIFEKYESKRATLTFLKTRGKQQDESCQKLKKKK